MLSWTRRLTSHVDGPLKPAAVVDVTCEMPEAPALCGCGSYLMLPVLDGSAPAVSQLRAAKGMSQRAFASHLGVAHGTVAKAEKEPDRPVGKTLHQALIRAHEEWPT